MTNEIMRICLSKYNISNYNFKIIAADLYKTIYKIIK